MRSRTAVALTALALMPLSACFGGSTTDDLSYQIDESLTALVIDARAASVAIAIGDGPVTVTEEHRYSKTKPPPRTGWTARRYGSPSPAAETTTHAATSDTRSACPRRCRPTSLPKPAR